MRLEALAETLSHAKEKRMMLLKLQQLIVERYDVVESGHGEPIISAKLATVKPDTMTADERIAYSQLLGDPALNIRIIMPFWRDSVTVLVGESGSMDHAFVALEADFDNGTLDQQVGSYERDPEKFLDDLIWILATEPPSGREPFIEAVRFGFRLAKGSFDNVSSETIVSIYNAALKGTLRAIEHGRYRPPGPVKISSEAKILMGFGAPRHMDLIDERP